MKRQMREAAADQQEAARVACLAKRQEARERRAEERKVQQMKQREFQRELPAERKGRILGSGDFVSLRTFNHFSSHP